MPIMGKFKVGVVLLNYLTIEDTEECLRSINDLDYTNVEVIVVDNGSSANILNKLSLLPYKFSIISNGQNFGFSRACNIGIESALKANCDYILLLNNDTVMRKESLSELIANCQDERVGVATGKIYYYNTNKLWFAGATKGILWDKPRGIGCEDCGSYDKQELIRFASGCFMLIKAAVFTRCGFLDERFFFGGEDRLFCSNVLKAGFQITYIPSAIIEHKVSSCFKLSPAKVHYGYLVALFSIKCIYQGLRAYPIFHLYKIYGFLLFLKVRYIDKDIVLSNSIYLAFKSKFKTLNGITEDHLILARTIFK